MNESNEVGCPSLRTFLIPTLIQTLLLFTLVTGSWAATGADLSGSWVRNAEQSDDIREMLEEAMSERRSGFGGGMRGRGGSRGGSGGRGGGGGGRSGGRSGRQGESPPTSLLQGLAGEYTEISIEQTEEEITFHFTEETSRTLTLVEGAEKNLEEQYGSASSSWDGDALVVRTETTRRGETMTTTETWKLSEEGGRLRLTFQVSSGPLAGAALVQVYDRDAGGE